MSVKKKFLIFSAICVWILAVGAGWTALSKYQNTPGKAPASPQEWPSVSSIHRQSDLPTLVMFLHPHCPCSRASLAQLSSIMTHAQNKMRTQVVFVKPVDVPLDWVKTDLYEKALKIPGVNVMIDEDGREAEMFHGEVSGQVMLYDASGQLVFSGGITASRGHEGDNDGQDAILSFLNNGTLVKDKTPFFGCVLENKEKRKI
jgi:hypothetical protein